MKKKKKTLRVYVYAEKDLKWSKKFTKKLKQTVFCGLT